jgi:hypothetical protein
MGQLSLLGSGGSASGPTVLLKDAFTDADGTNLTAHTMDIGGGWAAQQGGWKIQGNQAALNADVGDHNNVATASAGQGDVTATCDCLTVSSGNIDFGVVINCADNSNYWLFLLANVGGEQSYRLFEKTAGSYTQRARVGVVIANGATLQVKVVTSGDTITCYIGGVQQFSYNVAGRPNKTATGCGLYRHGTADDGSTYDNFQVTT